MFHPASGVRLDRNEVLRVRRVFGLYQSSLPGHHVCWHRDINAAINMLKNFLSLYHDGFVPVEFLQSTPRDELLQPDSLRYAYRWLAELERLERFLKAAPAADI